MCELNDLLNWCQKQHEDRVIDYKIDHLLNPKQLDKKDLR